VVDGTSPQPLAAHSQSLYNTIHTFSWRMKNSIGFETLNPILKQ